MHVSLVFKFWDSLKCSCAQETSAAGSMRRTRSSCLLLKLSSMSRGCGCMMYYSDSNVVIHCSDKYVQLLVILILFEVIFSTIAFIGSHVPGVMGRSVQATRFKRTPPLGAHVVRKSVGRPWANGRAISASDFWLCHKGRADRKT